MDQPQNTPESDIALAKAGDAAALNRLLEHNQQRLVALARKRIGSGLRNRIHPSDLLQSTLFEVSHCIDRFRGHTNDAFIVWVARMMENNARQKVRFFQRRKRTQDDADVTEGNVGDAPSPIETPSHYAAWNEEVEVSTQALRNLPAEYQRIIGMRILDDFDHEEAGSALGKSEGAARSLLARARAAWVMEIDRLRRLRGHAS